MEDKQSSIIMKQVKEIGEYLFIAKWMILIMMLVCTCFIIGNINTAFQELHEQIAKQQVTEKK